MKPTQTQGKYLLGASVGSILMSPNLVLLPRLLIHKRPRQNRVTLDACRQWDRPMNSTMSSLCGINNILGTLIQDRVIVCFHTNTNYFTSSSRHRSITQKSVEGISQKANQEPTANGTRRKSEGAGQARSLASLWTLLRLAATARTRIYGPTPNPSTALAPRKQKLFWVFLASPFQAMLRCPP